MNTNNNNNSKDNNLPFFIRTVEENQIESFVRDVWYIQHSFAWCLAYSVDSLKKQSPTVHIFCYRIGLIHLLSLAPVMIHIPDF